MSKPRPTLTGCGWEEIDIVLQGNLHLSDQHKRIGSFLIARSCTQLPVACQEIRLHHPSSDAKFVEIQCSPKHPTTSPVFQQYTYKYKYTLSNGCSWIAVARCRAQQHPLHGQSYAEPMGLRRSGWTHGELLDTCNRNMSSAVSLCSSSSSTLSRTSSKPLTSYLIEDLDRDLSIRLVGFLPSCSNIVCDFSRRHCSAGRAACILSCVTAVPSTGWQT